MIFPNIYCKVSGMAMHCIVLSQKETGKLPFVIEVGCADGQGTSRYAGWCRQVLCIDAMAAGRPDLNLNSQIDIDHQKIDDFIARTKSLASFNFDGKHSLQQVQLIVGLSQDPETVKATGEFVQKTSLCDVLIIDAAHHPFEAVLEDFLLYKDFVRPGGYIIFDDLYEDDVLKVYVKAQEEFSMVEIDRYFEKSDLIIQDVGALKTSCNKKDDYYDYEWRMLL